MIKNGHINSFQEYIRNIKEVKDLERILNDNEKLRKAEEIYYRRNHKKASISENVRQYKQKTYLGSKIILEMLILLISAIIVFAVKNKDYIFTKEFLASCEKYNINLTQKLSSVTDFFSDDIDADNIFINNTKENPEINEHENNAQIVETPAEPVQTQTSEKLVTDVEELNRSYSFIKPLDGIVTSNFGKRESSNKNVTSNHTGIDIFGIAGTPIKSSISGTVVQVSNEGDYGNHIKICKNNITTLYAHCESIFVTEGQEIIQGQEIASVGSTGNSTGPHLHFEIRINEIPINPIEIINFSEVL